MLLLQKKPKYILSCINRNVTHKSRKTIFPHYTALKRPHREYRLQFGAPDFKTDMDISINLTMSNKNNYKSGKSTLEGKVERTGIICLEKRRLREALISLQIPEGWL